MSVSARRVKSSELGVGSDEEKIYSELNGNFIEISVADTGIGIAKEDMERLFVPFQQLEPMLTKKHGGADVGLYLAKRLVDMHSGRIWAESEKGKGSKFIFAIPLKGRQQAVV